VSAGPLEAAEEVRQVRGQILGLLGTYATGRIVQEGARLAIAGRVNAGKSTLFNYLLREDRSIVAASPGTTRDYVDAAAVIGPLAVRLFDTAGLREAREEIELEGIRRTEQVIEGSDIVVYLVDATTGLDSADVEAMERIEPARLVKVWNKTDVSSRPSPEGFLPLSGRTGAGVDRLREEVRMRLVGGQRVDGSEPVIDSARQKLLLERAADSLERAARSWESNVGLDIVAVDLREALDALGEITGEVTSAEILRAVFANFCVGK
jgi:tRNA modification GTPase